MNYNQLKIKRRIYVDYQQQQRFKSKGKELKPQPKQS
jgi:hypothetical protein